MYKITLIRFTQDQTLFMYDEHRNTAGIDGF